MSRSKIGEGMGPAGPGYFIPIPDDVLEKLGWRIGDDIQIDLPNDKSSHLILSKFEKKGPIYETK